MSYTYCDCAGAHKPGCPNAKPDGLPPLRKDENEDDRGGRDGRRGGRRG